MTDIDMANVAKVHCFPKQVNAEGRTVGYILADREGVAVAPMQFKEADEAKAWARRQGLKCEWDGHWALTEDVHDYLVHHPFREDYGCVFCGGVLDGKRMTVAELRAEGLVSGKRPNLSAKRATGEMICAGVLFDDAPTVAGYVGPMYGGTDTPLRYETAEVYQALSV